MIALDDFQLELGGVVFGIGSPDSITLEDGGWDTGTPDARLQDGVLGQRDGVTFGTDFLDGETWAFTLSTDCYDDQPDSLQVLLGLADPVPQPGYDGSAMANARAAVEKLKTAWTDPAIRLTPGKVTTLRYCIGGRTRRVYGRPRNFAAPMSNRAIQGYIPIVCDFKTVDMLRYDDNEQQARISLAPRPGGGWRFPLRFPFTPKPLTDRDDTVMVGGTAPTWPIITIYGPLVNPVLDGPGWTMNLSIGLGHGEYVQIDTRPWVQTILKNGSRPVPGILSKRQLLRNFTVTPGSATFVLHGNTAGTGAGALIRWRDAYTAL